MNKRKMPKTLQKPLPIVDSNRPAGDNTAQFELELYWCVQQLEQSLCSGKLTEKIAEETKRNIKSLKSSTVPLVRKRQLMKNLFGDYRTKMKEEEKKLGLAAKQIKFTENTDSQRKFSFVKKAAILSSGKDFRFNFEPSTEENKVDEQTESIRESAKTNGLSDLKFSTASNFKFNFKVEEDNDINLSGLSIKS